ncbi:MAG: helix-turn-helix transcriptional regulator [Candidatus Bathyarchaeota archaeon]|nr:helix-turn-helix transcriptional regulator [Candidatus Bathyarchaeota archaeon]
MKTSHSQLQPSRLRIAGGLNHTLHLYTPKVDKYAIQRAFLSSTRDDEKAVYVTTESPTSVIGKLNLVNVELKVIKPEQIRNLEMEHNCKLRIVIDAGSIANSGQLNTEIEEREEYINNLSKEHAVDCLCTYDVGKLGGNTIKQLAACHNQLRLTTSDLTILSGDLFQKSKLPDDSIRETVKKDLETIVLALIEKRPMCGTDITEIIHIEFNLLLSPGTIYPLLHSLQERGLIASTKHGKAKIYTPAKGAELKIRNLVNERVRARKFLNNYLQQEATIEERRTKLKEVPKLKLS